MAIISVSKGEWNDQYVKAVSFCSDNIKGFLKALNNRDSSIDWALLDRNGFRMSDGSYFRVISSLRNAKEQIEIFKRGREGVKFTEYNNLTGVTPFSGVKYLLSSRGTVVNNSAIATYAWAGESYHNWGLAVDICFRLLGEDKTVTIDGQKVDFKAFYKMSGILDLAKRYNLNWGTEVNFEADMTHFEDSNSYKIPPKEVHYDKNMNADFVQWYWGEYANRVANDDNTEIEYKSSKKSYWIVAGVVAFVAICLTFRILGKNKRRGF